MREPVSVVRDDRRAEAEAFALRALVTYPEMLVESGLDADHFLSPALRRAFEALPATVGRTPDGAVPLANVAAQAGLDVETLRGVARLQVTGADQARVLFSRLRSRVTADRVRAAVVRLSQRDFGDDPGLGLLAALEDLTRRESTSVGTSETRTLRELTEQAIRDAEAELAAGKPSTLRSSLATVNRAIRGYRPGELTLLAAEGGAGKTSLATQEAREAGRQGRHVLYVSGEMTASQLGEREAHGLAGVAMREGLSAWALKTAREQLAACSYPDFVHYDTRFRTKPAEVIAEARRVLSQRGNLGLLIYDHAKHMDVGEVDGDHAQYAAATSAAKEIAKAVPCPVLMLTHLNRSRRGAERPSKDMLRGAGEDVADSVLCLWRRIDETLGEVTELHFLKTRQTGVGDCVPLAWDRYSQSYEEIAVEGVPA